MKRYYLSFMNDKAKQIFPIIEHNHCVCLDEAITRARVLFDKQDTKWTNLRELVFREVASSHKPVSAYELIDRLAAGGRRLAPVSIYRILDVLQKVGVVHKLESRNAYFACMTHHGGDLYPIVLICDGCGRVAEHEAPDAMTAIMKTTMAKDFAVKSAVLEVSGVCGECHGITVGA